MAKKGGGSHKLSKGKRKVAKSRFLTYAGVMGASNLRFELRKLKRSNRLKARRDARVCDKCGRKGFRDRREHVRHMLRCTGPETFDF